MIITKKGLQKKLQKTKGSVADALEQEINRFLSHNYQDTDGSANVKVDISVTVTTPLDFKKKLVRAILMETENRYTDSWKIKKSILSVRDSSPSNLSTIKGSVVTTLRFEALFS